MIAEQLRAMADESDVYTRAAVVGYECGGGDKSQKGIADFCRQNVYA